MLVKNGSSLFSGELDKDYYDAVVLEENQRVGTFDKFICKLCQKHSLYIAALLFPKLLFYQLQYLSVNILVVGFARQHFNKYPVEFQQAVC
jgi:hypothetical protein